MEKVKIGIAGLGRLGREHAANIHKMIPDAELTAVCSIVQSEIDGFCRDNPVAYTYTDYMAFLANEELDAIVIATTTQTHCNMICQAIEAGHRNIYTEKPLGLTLEEIDKIKVLADKTEGLILQVGYNHRFDKNLVEAKEKIDAGFIGDPILLRIESRDQVGIEEFIVKFSPTSGGFIADMMTHDFDTARWLTNSEPEVIFGIGDVYAYQGLKTCGDMDNTSILMKFKNKTMVVLTASRNSPYGYHAPLEIFGTKGTIRVGAYSNNNRNVYMNENGVSHNCTRWFYEYWQETYLEELRDFVRCIIQRTPPKVDYNDGHKAVAWALKATEAVRQQKIITL